MRGSHGGRLIKHLSPVDIEREISIMVFVHLSTKKIGRKSYL